MHEPNEAPLRLHAHSSGVSYDFLVFIGRFQPFHSGHRRVVETALRQAGHVVVLVGSAFAAPSYRNPWGFDERRAMIADSFTPQEVARLIILPLEDRLYNNTAWVSQVQEAVDDAVEARHDFATSPRIGLIGLNKDNTSYYLKLFPQWDSIGVDQQIRVAATDLRENLFRDDAEAWLAHADDAVPANVRAQLAGFRGEDAYHRILEEYRFIRGYRQAWATAPYEPVFVTTDAVVIQSGHVLLIERGARPGKGLLALPGGYLGTSETIEDSMLRELREETRIRVPDPVLRGSIVGGPKVFDEPHRDPRGRFITHAFLLALAPRREEGFKLPKVKGGDDAATAHWLPLAECRRVDMFLDHYDIIQNMAAQL
jgi:bifunctional NMN adenylyltransferase/nudix hydrolase